MSNKPNEILFIGYEEEWRFIYIRNEKTKYQVSNLGRIRNVERDNAILAQIEDRYGYNQVCLSHKAKKYVLGVHRLVALAFIINDDPEHKVQVNHKNGKKYDNEVTNLEWSTPQENTIHAYQTGLHNNVAKGENHGQNVYSSEDIRYVCELLETGRYTVNEVVSITNIPRHTINDVYTGKYWKHISSQYDLSNIKQEHPKDFEILKPTIIDLHNSGKSNKEIILQLGLENNDRSQRAIRYYIKRYCEV